MRLPLTAVVALCFHFFFHCTSLESVQSSELKQNRSHLICGRVSLHPDASAMRRWAARRGLRRDLSTYTAVS